MRNPKRAALAAAPLSLALLLAACGSDDDSADDATTTTAEATTASTEATAPPAGETTAPPSTEPSETTQPDDASDPPGDGALPEDPREWAAELVRAWGAGERERAGELATAEVVDQLFAHADPGGSDWQVVACDGTNGLSVCTFASASRGEALSLNQPTDFGLQPIDTATIDPSAVENPTAEANAVALVRAWGAGDRAAVAELALPAVVDQLFGRYDPGGPSWDLRDCLTISGDPQCIFYDPDRDERLIVHHRPEEGDIRPVSFIEFREGASG